MMKRFIVAAILTGALVALVGGTALAAGPVTPPGQGFGAAVSTQATGTCPCGGVGAGTMVRRGAPEWAGEQGAVADLLDMTQGQIQVERQKGKSLAQIAAAKGVSEDTLVNTILSAKEDVLAKLVADKKITQAQADLMIQNMTARVKTMVERTDIGPAGFRGGAGLNAGQGMRGGRWNRS